MKYLVLLALLTSCGSMTKEKPAESIESAGESDAKPVSPYTVRPCYCMKIFRPVCAQGQNFGNSCEAECHGHKTWTEGQCGKPQR
jgi:hypothetical protein